MSIAGGLGALRLEMPEKIPRTEYSAHFHWELVNKVTGMHVNSKSGAEVKEEASRRFVKAWDYGFFWNILTHNNVFDGKYTKLGHAEYMADGEDFSEEVSSLLEDPEDVFSFDPFEIYGERREEELIRQYDENYDNMCVSFPDTVNMTGIYITCISGALEILGWDTLLLAAGMDLKEFGAFIGRYERWIGQYFKALARCKAETVMIHDDITWTSGAFLHPDFYRTYIFPAYKRLFQPLFQAGKRVLFTSDGNYTEFLGDIADCGVHGFVFEPCMNLADICEQYGSTHVLVGNADTRILLMGEKEDIRQEVKRCIDIGRSCPGYIMAVGNHIPANTPVENALWYQDFYEKYCMR